MSDEYCLDANVFITAWNECYQQSIFPSLWRALAEHHEDIILIKPIYDQIDPFSQSDGNKSLDEKRTKYPLRVWLMENNFNETPIDESVERKSLLLEKEYETNDEPKGADQKDIKLIAYAKLMNKTVVTFENEQTSRPRKKSNYKIPLICSEQQVECIKFVEMLKRLDIRI